MRVLSGIQPSGNLHLGNYFGAIRQQIDLQSQHDCVYFIADYHALTSVRDPGLLRTATRDVAAAFLALGLKTEQSPYGFGSVLYRQSDVPEVTELAWLLNCVTPVGLMQRAPAYKEKVDRGLPANMGLFSYPILMAADILMNDAQLVPVGKDQLPHIDIAQDVAGHFNSAFKFGLGPIFGRPEALLGPTPKVPGTDGQKMSKSYGNVIEIFAGVGSVKKQVAGIVTDNRRPGEPGRWGGDNASAILDLFLDDTAREDWKNRLEVEGVGYKDIKQEIVSRHQDRFGPARERFELLTQPGDKRVERVLEEGAENIRHRARIVLERVRTATGLR